MMKTTDSPFQLIWMSFDLGEYRPCDGTYCPYVYDSLPPIPDVASFSGKFEWLQTESSDIAEIHAQTSEDAINKQIAILKAEAERLNITLPQGFEFFFSSEELRMAIPSCTACYFTLSEKFIPAPIAEGGYFLRFYNDQQDVLLWYIYFAPSGEHCVVVSNLFLDDEEYLHSIPEDAIKRSMAYCAPSFEAFLYRVWLENTIWFKLDDGSMRSAAESAYLQHYEDNAEKED